MRFYTKRVFIALVVYLLLFCYIISAYASVYEKINIDDLEIKFDEEKIPSLDDNYGLQIDFAPDNIREFSYMIHLLNDEHNVYFKSYIMEYDLLSERFDVYNDILECYNEAGLIGKKVEVEISVMFGYGETEDVINYTSWSQFSNRQYFYYDSENSVETSDIAY